MARVTIKGTPVQTSGELPAVGSQAPDFTLTKATLEDVSLGAVKGKKLVLNIFPSVDTAVCAASVRRFNAEASKRDDTVVACVSADLPFAQARFCGAEGLDKVMMLSAFRHREFGDRYGVRMVDGPFAGLLSRAVLVIDPQGTVVYRQQVPEIADEPDYDAALKYL